MNTSRLDRVRIIAVITAVAEALFLLALWLFGFPPERIPAIAAIVGLPTAMILLIYQLSVQHELALEQQREGKRLEIKSDLYARICKAVTHADIVQSKASIDATFLPINLRTYLEQRKLYGNSAGQLRQRATEIGEANVAALSSLTTLSTLVEQHLIVNPCFRVFQLAFSEARQLIENTFQPFYQRCLWLLPMDLPDGVTRPSPEFSEDDVVRLEGAAKEYADAINLAGCYVYDFLVEMQNELLGDVFENRAPIRQPIDRRFRVIAIDKESVDEYTRYFYRETDAGKRQKQAEENARRVTNRGKGSVPFT